MTWKRYIQNLLLNAVLFGGALAFFALLFLFVWNDGVTYLIPFTKEMFYVNALAITAGGLLFHVLVNFYHNMYLRTKHSRMLVEAFKKQIEEGEIKPEDMIE